MKGFLILVLIVVGGLVLMDPFASPNFTTLLLVIAGVAIIALVVVFATGSNIQVGGHGNRIGDTHIHINEQPSSQEVNRWMNGD